MESTEAKKFTSISSYFAQATLKFTDNHQFAYLCSFLIENSKLLITDSHNDFLFNNFNRDSDIITLLNAIYQNSKYNKLDNCSNGLSNAIITTLYENMSNNFDSCDGQKAVVDAIKWSRNQDGGILAMVDKFVSFLLEIEEFKEKRRYEFVHALNANFDNHPTIIFKSIDDCNTQIAINNRPGWHGLEIPGNIIILNDDYLIHHDHMNQIENPGIVGLEINNPSVNSIFYLSLLESYLDDQDIDKDFVKICRSPNQEKENAFLLHISNDNDQTIINFCPRTNSIEKIFGHIFTKLLSLMPFLPYSIIFNNEPLGSAIEVKGYGSSFNYIEKVLPYSEPDKTLPFAYPLCRETLEFASHNIEEMGGTNSTVRFAITGENLLYNQNQPNGGDPNQPARPDVAMKSNYVFDRKHPSRLVLLVDQNCCDKPQTKPLQWISPPSSSNENSNNDNNNDNDNNDNDNDSNTSGASDARPSNSLIYIPQTSDEELIQLNQLVRDKENDTTCLFMCSPPSEYLKHPLFIYQGYNKSKAVSICRKCQLVVFHSHSELTTMIDPKTHKINETQFHKMYQQMSGISLNIEDGSNAPLGQIIWPLMNDTELFVNYVKSYFTLYVEFAIRSSRNYFTFCPNHPSFIKKIPKSKNQKICCPYCSMIYCCKCKNWHKSDEPCDANQIPDAIKFCPRCLKPISKISGSGVLICNCGAIFCFACGDKSPIFNSAEEAYEHVFKKHIKNGDFK